jgi:acetyltransferase
MLRGSRNAMRALAAVAGWEPRQPPLASVSRPLDLSDLLHPGALSEYDSGSVLLRYRIATCDRRRANNADEAGRMAAELGFPVVVKREGSAHKSRDGGVIVGLADEASVRAAAARRGGTVRVAAQLRGDLEVFCGMTRDPEWGPVVAVGLGGTAVEHLPGVRSCIAPIKSKDALRLVRETDVISRALSPKGQLAIAAVLCNLGQMALEHPEITAVDVNPLIVDEHGAVAVDALVVVSS